MKVISQISVITANKKKENLATLDEKKTFIVQQRSPNG